MNRSSDGDTRGESMFLPYIIREEKLHCLNLFSNITALGYQTVLE